MGCLVVENEGNMSWDVRLFTPCQNVLSSSLKLRFKVFLAKFSFLTCHIKSYFLSSIIYLMYLFKKDVWMSSEFCFLCMTCKGTWFSVVFWICMILNSPQSWFKGKYITTVRDEGRKLNMWDWMRSVKVKWEVDTESEGRKEMVSISFRLFSPTENMRKMNDYDTERDSYANSIQSLNFRQTQRLLLKSFRWFLIS